MPLPSLLIQEVEAPLAVALPISEDISVVSASSLEVAPIQNSRVGRGALAHTLITVGEADPSRDKGSKICSQFAHA